MPRRAVDERYAIMSLHGEEIIRELERPEV